MNHPDIVIVERFNKGFPNLKPFVLLNYALLGKTTIMPSKSEALKEKMFDGSKRYTPIK